MQGTAPWSWGPESRVGALPLTYWVTMTHPFPSEPKLPHLYNVAVGSQGE